MTRKRALRGAALAAAAFLLAGIAPVPTPALPLAEGHTTIVEGVAWRVETDGPVRGGVAVYGDDVVAASTDGNVYALALDDGQERWRYDAGESMIAAPAAAGGRIFVRDRANTLHAIDASTGAGVWRRATGADLPLPWGFEGWDYVAGGPVVDAGTVYLASGDGHVYAFSADNGTELWRHDTGARLRAAPALAGDRLFVGDAAGVFHALDRASGEAVWTFDTDGREFDAASAGFDRNQIYSAASVADGTVYFGSRDARTYALDAATGSLRWKVDDGTSAWVIATPTVHEGLVLTTRSSSTRVRALTASDGSERWAHRTGNLVFGSVMPLDPGYVVANGAGILVGYDDAGAERWRYGVGTGTWSTPTRAGDRLYLGSDDGAVYALDLGIGPAPELVVYADDEVAARSLLGQQPSHAHVTEYFRGAGYRRVDDDALVEFLQGRIADGRPSVVVFAIDGDNAALDAEGGATPLLRRYLEAGGRAVWLGQAPGLFVRNEEGQITGLDRSGPEALLGVDHSPYNTDLYPVWPTAAGRERGLHSRFLALTRIDPGPETVVLARDELGRAVAWEQPYGPAGGRRGAFVAVWVSFDRQRLDEIRAVAEYGIYRSPLHADRVDPGADSPSDP